MLFVDPHHQCLSLLTDFYENRYAKERIVWGGIDGSFTYVLVGPAVLTYGNKPWNKCSFSCGNIVGC